MTNEFKETFERIRQMERGWKMTGAANFYTQILSKLDTIHPDTDMTVGMFVTMIEEEAEQWILNSADHD